MGGRKPSKVAREFLDFMKCIKGKRFLFKICQISRDPGPYTWYLIRTFDHLSLRLLLTTAGTR